MHKHAPGFFPGTGGGSSGSGAGRGFALNLPLADGIRDELFAAAFSELAGGAVAAYDPGCIVLQW
jgi:acetoin utilization deacetylase AcuC-like enzyme